MKRKYTKQPAKQTRQDLGLSQVDLAAFLGISRTRLIKAETGECGLTTAALHKVAQLERCMRDAAAFAATEKPNISAKARSYCKSRTADINFRLASLKRKLADMTAINGRQVQILGMLDQLETETADSHKVWISALRNKTEYKLSICSEEECELIRTKIFFLTAEAESLKEYLNKTA